MAVAKYKVLTDAITVRLKAEDTKVSQRFRNQVIELDDEVTDVENLLRLKAITKSKSDNKRTDAATLVKAAGGNEDPLAGSLPVPGPNEESAPPAVDSAPPATNPDASSTA